jgi:hypothetical protein
MSITNRTTKYLIEEMTTDGHAPLKFMCDDDEIYYCKYLNAYDKLEIDCLAYEVVAHNLLKELQIPTPDIALVTVSNGSLDKSKIKVNRRVKEGTVCFGSKAMEETFVLNDLVPVLTKKDFNRIQNPEDLIKIAIFDLWVNNSDRGRYVEPGFNYNLLIRQKITQEEIIAFDHAFIFGGTNSIGIFNKSFPMDKYNKIHTSPYYKEIVKFIAKEEFEQIVNNFIPLLRNNYEKIIRNSISDVQKVWNLTLNLDKRIIDYLSSLDRIKEIHTIILHSKS